MTLNGHSSASQTRRYVLQLKGLVLTRQTRPREKLIKIGAKVISDGRYVAFQMAEVAIPRDLFADILWMIAELRLPPIASTA